MIGANFVIQSLDPGRSIETTTNMVNHSTYDSLVTFDGEDLTTPKPRLASEWTVSEDGTSYTFTLQPDVTFASGNPLTSADVKWSFDRVRNLQSNPLFLVEKITGVEAPDPQTVVITSTRRTRASCPSWPAPASASSTVPWSARTAARTPLTRPRPTRRRSSSTASRPALVPT